MRNRPHRIPPLDRALAILAYREHMPVPEIAKALLRCEQVIYRILTQAGYGKTKSWNKYQPRCAVKNRSKKFLTKSIEASKPKGKQGRGPAPRKRVLVPPSQRTDPLLARLRTQSTQRTIVSTHRVSNASKSPGT